MVGKKKTIEPINRWPTQGQSLESSHLSIVFVGVKETEKLNRPVTELATTVALILVLVVNIDVHERKNLGELQKKKLDRNGKVLPIKVESCTKV